MPQTDSQQEKFLRVFLQNEDHLKAYARALLPTWEAVNEVMQEASVVMWRKIHQLRDEADFLPWAKVIVRYEALKARQTVARDRLSFREDIFDLLAEESSEEVPDFREDTAFEHCLAKLDESQRTLVLLPYHGHGAVLKLADQSGKTVNSLYKKIGRLRLKLMKCIDLQLSSVTPKEGLS